MGKIKPAGKILLFAALGAGIYFTVQWYQQRPQEAQASTVVTKVVLPSEPEASLPSTTHMMPLPSDKPAGVDGVPFTHYLMPWSSQAGLALAVGGTKPTEGSIAAKLGLNVTLVPEPNCDLSIAAIAKFAQDYKNDESTPGVLCSYMGDGMPTFFANLVKVLEPLGPDYMPVAFYAMGKSFGEDKFMGPAEWKRNPKAAIGKTVSCYLRDGDMNIVLNWASNNNVPVNPDPETYDSLALNLVAATDFKDAAAKYVANYREERFIVRNGMRLSDKVEVGIDAVATWTPGDVTVARMKGGLVSIVSTREYSTQMPNITIGIRKWLNNNRSTVENYIVAMAQGGDQVRSFGEAKKKACYIQAAIYNEPNEAGTGDYWFKYYNGVVERDAQGLQVELGGSMVFNLADATSFFGMGDDHVDRYKVVYTTFGDILSKMYPELIPTYPPYQQVVDKSFMATVMSNHPELLEGKALETHYAEGEITEQVSSGDYSVHFNTGSTQLDESDKQELDKIWKSVVIAEDLRVRIYGHTDNVGNDQANLKLSQGRAAAVADYLTSKGVPQARVASEGRGETEPVADNGSPAGQAKNRRVQVVLGR